MVKLGLGDSYEKTIINEKIRAYIDITKPASSIGVMLTIPFAAVFHAELNGFNGFQFLLNNAFTVSYASVTLFLIHGGSQSLNMAEDAHIDSQSEHKSNRPIPAGVISKEEARSLAWIFIMAGMVRAYTINTQFGVLATVLALFGVFYNLNPIRAKEHLWFNLGWQAASRGLILYPAAFAVWGEGLNPIAWIMGITAFMLVLAMQNTADFSDVKMDEEFGIITPAVYHGLDSLTLIMTGITLMMFGFITVAIQLSSIPNLWSLYILAIPIGWSLQHLWRNPTSISGIGDNNVAWYVFYMSLASMYILPAVQLTLF